MTSAAAAAKDGEPTARAGYRRSAGSPRGEARRQELLDRVTEDLAANGLVDFSLRRAARAAGTTHKVLLYYFAGADDLLAQAVPRLRERRIEHALAAAVDRPTLAARVRVMWPAMMAEGPDLLRVLDQAMGLAMYDPGRYAALASDASEQYLPALLSICPAAWSDRRKHEVAELVLAALRGFLFDWRSTGDRAGSDAGLEALVRALEREEAADSLDTK